MAKCDGKKKYKNRGLDAPPILVQHPSPPTNAPGKHSLLSLATLLATTAQLLPDPCDCPIQGILKVATPEALVRYETFPFPSETSGRQIFY